MKIEIELTNLEDFYRKDVIEEFYKFIRNQIGKRIFTIRIPYLDLFGEQKYLEKVSK